jgi:uncharacterized protein (TIGR02118 family)
MFKLIGYWTPPANSDDLEEFEDLYLNRHCVKAALVPNLKQLITMRVDEGLHGGDITHFRIAELLFEDREAYEEATESPEFKAMLEDGASLMDRFGVTTVGEIGVEVQHQIQG